MIQMQLPPREEMLAALEARDDTYDGVFVTAVKTTGIFCRPGCTARTPRSENVDFFASPDEALAAGFRPCLRCRPSEPRGSTPDWLAGFLSEVERDPARRWSARDLVARGLDPARVRRWFQAHHGTSFAAWQRARRLGLAQVDLRGGTDISDAALSAGYESESAFRAAFTRLFGATPGRARAAGTVTIARILSPLGPLVAGATDAGVCLLEFADRRMFETQLASLQRQLGCALVPGRHRLLDELEAQLAAYFARELQRFTLPLETPGTDFQRAVWQGLLAIPYGETVSYEGLAAAIGHPGAQRAIGRANGLNKIAIVIPCHRVIRADGTLCGYGGGLWRKRALLRLESARAPLDVQPTLFEP
jgi:AraC family transcriptional regulator of adaptative response/methylated-DNA-[protein]-cysteine methyltransferase